MKITILFLLVLTTNPVLGTQRGPTSACPNTKHLTVRTSTGTFTGLIDPEFPNTRQFRAIPFAEPPVVSRRWLPLKKLSSPPDEHHYATRFPPSCPQFVSGIPSFWNGDLTRGNLIYNGAQNDTSGLLGEATSEDCFYLAIWTPNNPIVIKPKAALLPVLFFMTGDGFVMGGVDLPWQIPTSWVERSQSHIVVSVNYRVNIFGFPNAQGLSDQNLGIIDQRAALEWVRDNIAAFGGDPKRITQWGRSAGAISADIHAYAYPKDPIAQAYFIESGTVLSSSMKNADPTHSNFTFVARHFGCDNLCTANPAENAKAELNCLRQAPFAQISNSIGQHADQGSIPALSISPVSDDRIIFADYKFRSETGKFARRPAIISATANEFSSLVPYPVDDLATGPDQAQVTAISIGWAVCPTFNSTFYRNRVDVPVFRIHFAATFPNLNYHSWLGAYHNSETPIVFGTYGLMDHVAPSTELQREMSRSVQDHILAFVEDPYHSPQKKMGWKPMVAGEANGGELIRFGGRNGKVVKRVDGDEVDGVCLGLRGYDSFP